MDVIVKKETVMKNRETNITSRSDFINKNPDSGKEKAKSDSREKTRFAGIIINFLIFLVPLFFLPFTFEFYNFNKMFLLFFGVTAIFLLTLWGFIKKGEIKIVRTPVDLFVAAYVFFALLSAIFSNNGVSGFLGFYGRFSGSFLEILLVALFWWLLVQNFYTSKIAGSAEKYSKKINGAVLLFLLSNLFVALFTIFLLFGLSRYLPESNFVKFLNSFVISPTGLTLQGLSVYFSAIFVFLISFIIFSHTFFTDSKSRGGHQWFYWILFILDLCVLVLIDFWVSWVILIIGLCLIFGIALTKRMFKEHSNWLVMPILIIILSFILLGINVHSLFNFNVTQEILLSPLQSGEIIGRSFMASPMFGSGPGNFWHNFNLYKGEEFLDSPFWQLRFSGSHFGFLENLSSVGIFGFVSLVGIFGMFVLVAYVLFKNNFNKFNGKEMVTVNQEASKNINYFLIFSIGVAVFLLASILYTNSIVLDFSLWFFLSLAILSWGGVRPGIIKTNSVDLKKFQELSVVFLSIFIILVLTIFAFWWQSAYIYIADVFYRKTLDNTATLDKKIEYLEKAVKYADYQENYLTGLSRGYMTRAEFELRKPQVERNDQKARTDVSLSIQLAKKAVESNAGSVTAWENLGSIYRYLGGAIDNAYVWAEDSFKKAILLDPVNPFLYVSLGKVQMELAISGGSLDEDKLNEALSNIKRARGLKEGYLGSYLNEALVLESQGKIEEAMMSLEDYLRDFIVVGRGVWQNQLEVADFFFQLGRVYYNNNDLDKAATNFVQAITLAPLHSNARYLLGMVLERLDKIDEAIQQFEIVLRLNPGDEALRQRIEGLKK